MNDDQNQNLNNGESEIRPEELHEPIEEETVEFVDTDEMGDELKDKAKLKKLRDELKQAQTEARDHLTALQRARADYVNLKRELDETREVTKKKTTERVVLDFLPVLDSFDMAMGNTDAWNAVDKNWRMGVEYIYSQLKTALENHGIEPIDKTGVEFDPNLHEPIETKETDDSSQDHKIERIIQKGYKMAASTGSGQVDRVIRPARVVVWKAK